MISIFHEKRDKSYCLRVEIEASIMINGFQKVEKI